MRPARVIVVGGGVIGNMHALFALRAGASVVHLERDEPASGASVRNFGLVWVSGRAAGPELQLALRARELWEEIGREIPDVGFRPNGSLTVVHTEDELAVLEQVVASADAGHRGLSLLGPEEVRRVNPGITAGLLGALHCTRDAAVEPRLVPRAVRARLSQSDRYERHSPCEVVDVDEHCAIDDAGRRHEADLVVLCVGAVGTGAMRRIFDDGAVHRVLLHMAQTEPLGRALTTSVADGNSLRYYPAFAPFARTSLGAQAPDLARLGIQLLCQQRLDGSLTIGDSHEYDEPFDFDVHEEPIDLVEQLARTVIGPPFPRIERRWTGVYHQLRQVTDDELYLRREVAPGVVAVTGAGGRGMTLAPAIAEETFA